MVSDKPDFNRIRVLGGLLHKIETGIIYDDIFNYPYVFYTTTNGSDTTNTTSSQLPKDKGPVEICHKWGNYPAFDLIEDLLKN